VVLTTTPIAAKTMADILPLDTLLQSFQKNQITTFLVWETIVLGVFALIILEYSLLCKDGITHCKAYHINNEYPVMTLGWLYKNMKFKHHSIVFLTCVLMFYLGWISK
jgi:hypothetical protein